MADPTTTHHRDSGLLDQSNAARMRRVLATVHRAVTIPTSWWSRTTIGRSARSTVLAASLSGQPITKRFGTFHALMRRSPRIRSSTNRTTRAASAASLENIDQAA